MMPPPLENHPNIDEIDRLRKIIKCVPESIAIRIDEYLRRQPVERQTASRIDPALWRIIVSQELELPLLK